ncbi:MAG: sensor histidine kinase [Bacteroidia bacterium]
MFKNNTVFLLLLTFIPGLAISQSGPDSSLNKNKLQLLKQYNEEANTYYNSFKNAPAFENLVKYGDLKENIFKEQTVKETSLKQNEWNFEIEKQKAKLSVTNSEISNLEKEQGSLISEKNRLLRNTLIYFAVIFGLAAFVLISRLRKLKWETTLQKISAMQLLHIHKMSDVAERAAAAVNDMLFSFHSMQELSEKSKISLSKLKSMAVTLNKSTEKIVTAEEDITKINTLSTEARLFSDYMDSMMKAGDEEVVLTNLNKIIEESLQLSYHWMCSRDENFSCTIVKDLEKILPQISIMPGAIGQAMFHFFSNAFRAVLERKLQEGKKFQPKVSVSSRKLPRFVQVRIKDNGTGIPDAVVPNIFKPFYTTHSPEISAGLGLSEAERIIKLKHKGEIIIETESGSGTDVVIRFPVNTVM